MLLITNMQQSKLQSFTGWIEGGASSTPTLRERFANPYQSLVDNQYS